MIYIIYFLIILFTYIILYNVFNLITKLNIIEGHVNKKSLKTYNNITNKNFKDLSILKKQINKITQSYDKVPIINNRVQLNIDEIGKIGDNINNASNNIIGDDPVKVSKKREKTKGLDNNDYNNVKNLLTRNIN